VKSLTDLRSLLIFTAVVIAGSIVYFAYASATVTIGPERETFFSEVGEVFGEAGLWLMGVIYGRTLLKVLMGKGKMARRLLPNYDAPTAMGNFSKLLSLLNRTHNYVGIAAVAVIGLHIAMMGLPLNIWFFPAVLALVIWQALFGLFLSWRYSPAELKKFSYLVHAQFATGILIGVFALFGHLLVDN